MITVTNNLKIHHKGSKILLAQCLVTGKFVKHSLALSALVLGEHEVFSKNELLKTKLVLSFCVLINIFVCSYLWSV